MSDPLDALHEPVRPVDPDPAFAARLRARLEREVLAAPRRHQEDAVTSTVSKRVAEALHSITPYLAVPDAAAALDFYVDAFGAVRRGDPIVMPDGRIGHAEVAIGDSVLMLAEQFPEMGIVAPREGESPASMRLEVPDPDAVVDRAVELGARLERPVSDSPYGRGGVVVDPAGHRWMVSREAAAGRPLQVGDVGYASLWRRDVGAAERFYGAVLGWSIDAVHSGRGRRITGGGQHLGMYGEQDATTMCCYAVGDVDATVALVRAAGGTAEGPTDEPFGRTASCVDDQGIPFAVFAPQPGSTRPDTTATGALTYLTIEVPDAGRARAFYGTVLGWGFRPGRVPEGWHAVSGSGDDTSPATGLLGGADAASVVPMFVVDDVAAAVAAVRDAGGTADDPADAGYGVSARCTDDQGAAFWVVRY
ncbi:glyoxalase [Pseudonocardia sulfidoxydans NBRC 16205]|uniref:Glyoxalase n=1 Tax=Pseudonocardia sulfidoxydans NBRC 16205 TaxID=1223511 RepID=A0A511DQ32_9PSEU|nr:VOC family protein [Pseudonocardia sulfidoxydans]GEL26951.1 glyoxalase [Pseudonocardia sulfidoxydans NBRC 16205]